MVQEISIQNWIMTIYNIMMPAVRYNFINQPDSLIYFIIILNENSEVILRFPTVDI
jgi:hypothetical protein